MKGHTSYNGLTCQQHPNFKEAFAAFLNLEKFSRVLEIGTAGGGTIQFIRDHLDSQGNTDTLIKTFEVKEHKWFADMRSDNMDIVIENIFSHSYREIEKPELVNDFIKDPGPVLVLCDGGCKVHEFNILSKFIKPGDFIMAHDYAPSSEYFQEHMKDKIWNWAEIKDEQIQASIDEHGLQQVYFDNFIQVAWCCFKK